MTQPGTNSGNGGYRMGASANKKESFHALFFIAAEI